MGEMNGHSEAFQNLAKHKLLWSSTGKTEKISANNKIVAKLASCLLNTRILKLGRELIHNRSVSMMDYTV